MSRILIGKAAGGNIYLDIDIFLRTRLLITSNSGGGKSWLIRRLAEQLFGKLQVILIDPEGEFATLREKFDYVLVGKGGETPADVRSASMLAHKLLELRASAVCDLYEMKPSERHRWVKLFLDSLIDAPKKLWHPVAVIIDEAHTVCPEKGAGESEASESVIALATRGRKRGFTCCFATQRLSKLRKDAAAELQNILVGPTFMDADRERAADALGVARADKQEFFDKIKVLEPGNFHALGRAISLERILVRIGPVETTHPESGSSKHAAEPPPAPQAIKAMLPKLSDLPKAAEEEARTIADLKREVRELRISQKAAERGERKTVTQEKFVVDKRAENSLKAVIKEQERYIASFKNGFDRLANRLQPIVTNFPLDITEAVAAFRIVVEKAPRPQQVEMKALPPAKIERAKEIVQKLKAKTPAANGDGLLGKCETAILATLAQHGECDIGRLALLSGYRQSGGFRNSLSKLRGLGYLEGANMGIMRITEDGLNAGDWGELPTGRDLFRYWLNSPRIGVCERAIMETLDGKSDGMMIYEIAEAAGYGVSGGFRNSLSKLRTAGVIVGRNTEKMRLSEELS